MMQPKRKKYFHIEKRIQESRRKLGLTQQDVAEELGIARATIGKLESTRRSDNAFIEYLVWLRKQEIDINELFEESDN